MKSVKKTFGVFNIFFTRKNYRKHFSFSAIFYWVHAFLMTLFLKITRIFCQHSTRQKRSWEQFLFYSLFVFLKGNFTTLPNSNMYSLHFSWNALSFWPRMPTEIAEPCLWLRSPMEIEIWVLSLLFFSRVSRLKRHSQITQWKWRHSKMCAFSWSRHGRLQSPLG